MFLIEHPIDGCAIFSRVEIYQEVVHHVNEKVYYLSVKISLHHDSRSVNIMINIRH